MVSPFAAIIISKKHRHIISAFREAGAISSENAKSLDEIALSKSVILDIKRLRGVLVKVEQNRFYLDEMQERKATRFRRILVLALTALVALIVWYFNNC